MHFLSSYWQYLILCLAGIFFMYFYLGKILRKLTNVTLHEDSKRIQKTLKKPAFFFSLFIFIKIFMELIGTKFPNLSYIEHPTLLLIVFASTWLVLSIVRVGKHIIVSRMESRTEDAINIQKVRTQLEIIEKIVMFVVIFIALIFALMTFESVRKYGLSIFTTAGITGIILGFAAQKMLSALLSGIQLAVTQPIRIGDLVVVEGEGGEVEEINLTYVSLRTWDLKRIVLPTTYFMEKPFQNWSKGSSELVGTVFLYVDYNVPIEDIRAEFRRLLENHPNWNKNEATMLVTNATERAVEIRATMSANDPGATWFLRCAVREGLIEFVRTHYPDSFPRTRVVLENKE